MTGEDCRRAFALWKQRLEALRTALTVMELDDRQAPSAGTDYRSRQRSVLAGEYRRVLHDPAAFEVLERLREDEGLSPAYAREAALYHRQLSRERLIPPEMYTALEQALSVSRRRWLQAKREGDFLHYAPCLQAVIDRSREIASLWQEEGSVYDRMLNAHQPGWNRRRYDGFFRELKQGILPLLEEIRSAPPIPEAFLHRCYPVEGQRELMEGIRSYLGFAHSWGRLGEGEHPLTSVVCAGDVRFTTKYRERDIAQAVFSTVHESGHAWHGHNIDPALDGSILAADVSAGLCESQSRLCENHLGRSRAFWQVHFPAFQHRFPRQLEKVTPEAFYRAVNRVKPTLIRTEADEVTYPLHILIRYELEEELMEGRLSALALEEAWNERYRTYLGIVPENPAEGVLQDMHWSWGYFGYFPTYALGSAMAAQFYHTMSRELDVEGLLLGRQYTALMDWLGEKIHRYGCLYEADEILHSVTGEGLNPAYYLQWLREKYTSLYGLS